MAEDKRITNQRCRLAFLRGFETGTQGLGKSDKDWLEVMSNNKIIDNITHAAYESGWEYGYSLRQQVHRLNKENYPE